MNLDLQLQKVIADFFKKEIKEINGNCSKDNIEEWDSLEHIKLILEIEEQFKVKFSLAVIPNLTSVNAILQEINKIKKNYV